MLGDRFDLDNIMKTWDIMRSVWAVREVTIMGVAANGRSIPALHRIIGAYDGGRALFDPRTRVWIDLRNLTIPTDL